MLCREMGCDGVVGERVLTALAWAGTAQVEHQEYGRVSGIGIPAREIGIASYVLLLQLIILNFSHSTTATKTSARDTIVLGIIRLSYYIVPCG